MAIGVAFKAFFAALFNRAASERLRQALADTPPPPSHSREGGNPAPTMTQHRSEALTLLGTLQREARFLDLVQESLDGFEDAQVGAAAREVLRDCHKSLDRMFQIEPLAEADEGERLSIAADASPNRVRMTGGSGQSGTIAHRGWQATKCEVPKWSGHPNDALLLAPTEVDMAS